MVTRALALALAAVLAPIAAFAQPPNYPHYKWTFIVSPKEGGKPHGSSILELPDGNLLATWYAAVEETNHEARIYGAIWIKNKARWQKPFVIIPPDYTKSVGNTALYLDEEGIIWMFFASVRIGGWSGSVIDYVQSRDWGKTWSEPENLVHYLGHLPRNTPIALGGHRMLAPFFIDFWYEANMVGSYTMTIEYKDGKVINTSATHLEDHDAIQPSIVQLPDGRILLLARDKSNQAVRRSFSNDEGKTWDPVSKTNLPNPGSAVSAIYIKDPACVLVVYNHSRFAANPLNLAVSLDEGKTFLPLIPKLGGDPLGNMSSYSYPSVIQAKDGYTHIMWTHKNRESLKHVWFNTLWLKREIGRAKRKLSEKPDVEASGKRRKGAKP